MEISELVELVYEGDSLRLVVDGQEFPYPIPREGGSINVSVEDDGLLATVTVTFYAENVNTKHIR